jgi:ribose transport system ATP-binding protein
MLELTGFSKAFNHVVVLDNVDFTLEPGEVHALLGENGAGKSTLINLVIGTYARTAGRMVLKGREIETLDPQTSRELGIAAVFQEFSLPPDLTVAESLFLGREERIGPFLRRGRMREAARTLLDEFGFHVPLDAKIASLSRAQKQMVEIAKALCIGSDVLILDEPTASLTDGEAEKLFEAMARLKARGVGIIYVSHRMSEIRTLSDRVTVLRGGKRVATVRTADVTDGELIEMMVGVPVDKLFPEIHAEPGPERLRVTHLTTASGSVRDASIRLHAGEVVGLAGLVGCGRSELCRAIFGLEPLADGEIILSGRHVTHPTPAGMLHQRLCYFPSDRGAEGLALVRPVRENVTMATLDEPAIASGPLLRSWDEGRVVRTPLEDLGLKPMAPERRVIAFSGGNQQKVMLSRGLMRPFDVYLFDEPTVGIDVNAKSDVYALIKRLVENGAAVILSSSELPELLHLASRIYVMAEGRIVSEIAGEERTEAAILSHYFSH